MSTETRDALLYGQLQEALWYELMRAPAVSGSTQYQELCVTSKNEEKWSADLCKRQQYSKMVERVKSGDTQKQVQLSTQPRDLHQQTSPPNLGIAIIARSQGTRYVTVGRKSTMTKQVSTGNSSPPGEQQTPYDLLFSSDSEGEAVKQVAVTDKGSRTQHARVSVQGVPASAVIDTGADITIMGGELFARVAAAAHLQKKNFTNLTRRHTPTSESHSN